MAAQANGRAKKPKKTTNGTLDGKLSSLLHEHMNGNGHVNGNGQMNGTQKQPSRPTARSRKPRRTIAGAATSIVGRYVIDLPYRY